jgi:hypothetical protein
LKCRFADTVAAKPFSYKPFLQLACHVRIAAFLGHLLACEGAALQAAAGLRWPGGKLLPLSEKACLPGAADTRRSSRSLLA